MRLRHSTELEIVCIRVWPDLQAAELQVRFEPFGGELDYKGPAQEVFSACSLDRQNGGQGHLSPLTSRAVDPSTVH